MVTCPLLVTDVTSTLPPSITKEHYPLKTDSAAGALHTEVTQGCDGGPMKPDACA